MKHNFLNEFARHILDNYDAILVGSGALAYLDRDMPFRDIDICILNDDVSLSVLFDELTTAGFANKAYQDTGGKQKHIRVPCRDYSLDTLRKRTLIYDGGEITLDVKLIHQVEGLDRSSAEKYSAWYVSQLIVQHVIPVIGRHGVVISPQCDYTNVAEIISDVKRGVYKVNPHYNNHEQSVFRWWSANNRLAKHGLPELTVENYPNMPWTHLIDSGREVHELFNSVDKRSSLFEKVGDEVLYDYLDFTSMTEERKAMIRNM